MFFQWRRQLALAFLALIGSGWCAQPPAENIGAQLERAAKLIKSGDLARGEQAARAILRADPKQPDALNLLGIVAVKQGRLDESESLFRQAISARPSLAASYANLAHLLEQKGDNSGATETLRAGLKQSPRNPDLLQQLAITLANRGNFAEAAQQLQAIPAAQRPKGYWELLARFQVSGGDLAGSEASLRHALDENPKSVPLLQQLAGVALKRGDVQRAWQYLAAAHRIAPNSPDLLYAYAQVSMQNKLAGEAVKAMRQAVMMEPDRPEYILGLGEALLDTADYHEALPHFQKYVELKPDDPKGHLSLGWSYFIDKKYAEAKQEFEETLRLDPKQADAYYHLGMIAYETNDDATALGMLTRAVALASAHAGAHLGLGMAYSRAGQYDKAREELETAVKLNPDEPKPHYQLSQVYARIGDNDRARAELQLYREAQKRSEEAVHMSEKIAPVPGSGSQ